MFCPKCRCEYREGFTTCSDCDVSLVSVLPPEPPPPETSPHVKLYSPRDPGELSLIQSILESEGIYYYVHNDLFGSLRVGPQIDLVNKKTIMVPDTQYKRP